MVQRPIFHGDELVGVGGAVGAHDGRGRDGRRVVRARRRPSATRRASGSRPCACSGPGSRQTDVFDIFRNNIRMSQLVEMDLRGLVAGCHFADERIGAVVAEVGRDALRRDPRRDPRPHRSARCARRDPRRSPTASTARRRGPSSTRSSTSFPARSPSHGDTLTFDFTGASPQTPPLLQLEAVHHRERARRRCWRARIASDLPFNEGVFACFELRCPEGTIVNAQPPAPIAAAHMHVSLNAADVAIQAFNSRWRPRLTRWGREWLTGPGTESALGNHVWSWTTPDGDHRCVHRARRQLGGWLRVDRARRPRPRPQPRSGRGSTARCPTSRSSSRGTRC